MWVNGSSTYVNLDAALILTANGNVSTGSITATFDSVSSSPVNATVDDTFASLTAAKDALAEMIAKRENFVLSSDGTKAANIDRMWHLDTAYYSGTGYKVEGLFDGTGGVKVEFSIEASQSAADAAAEELLGKRNIF